VPDLWDQIGEKAKSLLGDLRQHVVQGKTRCKVLVHSHGQAATEPPFDLTPDVVECITTKTFSTGAFQITVVPRKHYDNLIFPNDVVNIYLSSGTEEVSPQSGDRTPNVPDELVRVMLGYVDRVSRKVTTDAATGGTTTRYVINGTDITKALQRTNVYFDPHLARDDNALPIFGNNLAGIGMLSSGQPLVGTPTTFARGLILAFLGYGNQFMLPPNYPAYRNSTVASFDQIVKRSLDIEEDLFIISQALRNVRKSKERFATLLERFKEYDGSGERHQDLVQKPTLATLLDLFTYVEDRAVAGRHGTAPLHEGHFTVADLIYDFSNAFVNEFFVDLRLAGKTGAGKDENDIGPNYAPALVFREHPFSATDSVLITKALHRSEGSGSNLPSMRYLFGDVFFSSADQKATVMAAQPEKGADNEGPLTNRYVDHFVMPPAAVISEDTGYSDADLFNFMNIVADIWLASGTGHQAMILRDLHLFPLVNRHSIMVDGLRVKQFRTRFANWGEYLKVEGAGSIHAAPLANRDIVRFVLLLDHWYQWNRFYRSGTFMCRLLPKVRVGYRLDFPSPRSESYYVESVQHVWTYPGISLTTLSVTRGQPNEERLVYVPPESVEVHEPTAKRSFDTDIERKANTDKEGRLVHPEAGELQKARFNALYRERSPQETNEVIVHTADPGQAAKAAAAEASIAELMSEQATLQATATGLKSDLADAIEDALDAAAAYAATAGLPAEDLAQAALDTAVATRNDVQAEAGRVATRLAEVVEELAEKGKEFSAANARKLKMTRFAPRPGRDSLAFPPFQRDGSPARSSGPKVFDPLARQRSVGLDEEVEDTATAAVREWWNR